MPNVSFILVYVDDVGRSEAFYASLLGRPAVESSPTFAMLPAAPGVMLGLCGASFFREAQASDFAHVRA